jgi:hypothetical protein
MSAPIDAGTLPELTDKQSHIGSTGSIDKGSAEKEQILVESAVVDKESEKVIEKAEDVALQVRRLFCFIAHCFNGLDSRFYLHKMILAYRRSPSALSFWVLG